MLGFGVNRIGTRSENHDSSGKRAEVGCKGRAKADSFDYMNVCRKVMTSFLRGARRSRLPALTCSDWTGLPTLALLSIIFTISFIPGWSTVPIHARAPSARAHELSWTNEKIERNRGLFTWICARSNGLWLGKNYSSLESANPLASSPSKEIRTLPSIMFASCVKERSMMIVNTC